MKKTRVVLASVAALAVVVGACTDAINPLDPSDARTEGATGAYGSGSEADPFVTPLIAGRTMEVGVVIVWNDETTLSIKYEMTEPGWCLFETHLHVAESEENLPQTRSGNPIPGHFDHKMRHDCATEFTQEIDLDPNWVPGTTMLFIAAHADVSNGEGAWGKGTRFVERGNWAMYFNFTLAEPDDGGGNGDGAGGFAVRYRSFGNTTEPEIFLGAHDLDPGERVEEDFGSTAWAGSNGVTFDYDATADLLSTTVVIGAESITLEFPNAAMQVASLTGCALADMNRVVFTVAAEDAGSNVALNLVDDVGDPLASFSAAEGTEVSEFTISQVGISPTAGFTFTGDVVLTGSFGSDPDLSFVEIAILCPASG